MTILTTITTLFVLTVLGVLADDYPNDIYIIPNAEVPSLGVPGLTPIGQQRAQVCLPDFFGPSPKSNYDIGLIIACKPDERTGDCLSALPTVQPLANELKLTVNTTCGIEDDGNDCVENIVSEFAKKSSKSVLICWQLNDIDNLVSALDLNNAPDFPKSHYDVVWQFTDEGFETQFSENCAGIDVSATPAPSRFRRSFSTDYDAV